MTATKADLHQSPQSKEIRKYMEKIAKNKLAPRAKT